MPALIAKALLSADLTAKTATVTLDIHTDPAHPMLSGTLTVDLSQAGALEMAVAPLIPKQ